MAALTGHPQATNQCMVVTMPNRRKLMTTVYITPEQDELLKALSQRTKVPVGEYIRQGVDMVIEREAPRTGGHQLGMAPVVGQGGAA